MKYLKIMFFFFKLKNFSRFCSEVGKGKETGQVRNSAILYQAKGEISHVTIGRGKWHWHAMPSKPFQPRSMGEIQEVNKQVGIEFNVCGVCAKYLISSHVFPPKGICSLSLSLSLSLSAFLQKGHIWWNPKSLVVYQVSKFHALLWYLI